MLVLHDDAAREYAYGPAQGLPDTRDGRIYAGTLRASEEGWLDRHRRISDLLKFLLVYFTFSWKKELHVVAGDLVRDERYRKKH